MTPLLSTPKRGQDGSILALKIVSDFGEWSELGSRGVDGQTRKGEEAGAKESQLCVFVFHGSSRFKSFAISANWASAAWRSSTISAARMSTLCREARLSA